MHFLLGLMWHNDGCTWLFWKMLSNDEKGLREMFDKQVSYLLGDDAVLMALRPYKFIMFIILLTCPLILLIPL